ncbi:hypothetical protein (plasmid) [Metabacillus dongyingensis]|nr:hypothetical protein [Metabacillus dongyingensis]
MNNKRQILFYSNPKYFSTSSLAFGNSIPFSQIKILTFGVP